MMHVFKQAYKSKSHLYTSVVLLYNYHSNLHASRREKMYGRGVKCMILHSKRASCAKRRNVYYTSNSVLSVSQEI